MKQIAELYLVCLKCRRIPDWTEVRESKDEKGRTVLNYEFRGLCPFCNGEQFEVVEVRNEVRASDGYDNPEAVSTGANCATATMVATDVDEKDGGAHEKVPTGGKTEGGG
jgi:hypothetical protein